jgi:hypothetical protein
MLFKSFEKEVNASPYSTIGSIRSISDQEMCPEDNFRLNRCELEAALKERSQEMEKSVLDWFACRGIFSGYPELFKEEVGELKIKRVISSREHPTLQKPSLLERRLSKKLAINT